MSLKEEDKKMTALREQHSRSQKKTFEKWCNSYLQAIGESVSDLYTDFKDGIKLWKLVQLISGPDAPLEGRPKRSSLEIHQLENLSKVLLYLKNQKQLKMENIEPRDIYEGNPTLILGMIWTIILRMHIELIVIPDIEEEDSHHDELEASNAGSDRSKAATTQSGSASPSSAITQEELAQAVSGERETSEPASVAEVPAIADDSKEHSKTGEKEAPVLVKKADSSQVEGAKVVHTRLDVSTALARSRSRSPAEQKAKMNRSASDALLKWCQIRTKAYPEVRIKDFQNSWCDGLALSALIHKHRSNLVDYDAMKMRDEVGRLVECFQVAEKEFNIPKLLEAEDVVSHPDPRSMMLYVSLFYKYFRLNPSKRVSKETLPEQPKDQASAKKDADSTHAPEEVVPADLEDDPIVVKEVTREDHRSVEDAEKEEGADRPFLINPCFWVLTAILAILIVFFLSSGDAHE